MEPYLTAMKKYVDFSGRARRKEYWMFVLIYMVIYVAALVVYGLLTSVGGRGNALATLGALLVLAVALVHLLPAIAVAVRRLHDTGRSGWWLFIGLIPLIGAIVLLVFYCLDSDPGPNQYGDNPKGFEIAPA